MFLGAGLILFWVLLHIFIKSDDDPALVLSPDSRRRSPTTRSTHWTVHLLSLHISTTALNYVPPLLLQPFRKRRRRKLSLVVQDDERPLGWFWDVGALVGVVGLVVAQGVLAWAALRSVTVLLKVLSADKTAAPRLVKRAVEHATISASPAAELLLRPVIPGLTQPLSALPLLLAALLIAQIFHELGHGLAAASESIPVLSAGVHLWIALPTFYVALPSSGLSLKISAAGVWHNFVLVLAVWMLSSQGGGAGRLLASGFFKRVDRGVAVIQVDSSSPLHPYLPASSVITHLDDLELDSSSKPLDLWASYLSPLPSTSSSSLTTAPSYSSLGWCLPTADFSISVPPPCCTSAAPLASSTSHDLCFVMNDPLENDRQSHACLDPLPLFYPSKVIPQRCLDGRKCGPGLGCAMLARKEMVLRIGVGPNEREKVGRTVVWQGRRSAVLHHVSVSDSLPRFWWIPKTWLRGTERFYCHLLSLSLAVAFFNLLPLPHLDGSEILSSFLTAIASTSDRNLEEGLGILVPPPPSLLENILEWMRGFRWLSRMADAEEIIGKRLRAWTFAVGLVLVLATAAVEIISAHR